MESEQMAISSPTVLRRWVAFELARLRKDADLSQAQVAEQLGRTQSHISNLERGPGAAGRRNVPSWPDVDALLRIYERPDLGPQFRQLLEQSKRKHWAEDLPKGVIPPVFDLYLGLEEGATAIDCYDAMTVPGLLQCQAYAEVLLRGHGPDLSDEELARRVELRMRRQAVFDRSDDPLRLWSILDESVLYRRIGGPGILGKQLDHLLEMIKRPEIQFQILPLDAMVHPALHGSFKIMNFPTSGDAGLIYLESRLGGSYHEAQAEIDEYTEVMNHLRVIALDQEKSAQLIRKRRKELT
jgi:transcriptional regulator with XRE-family HTH domain